MTPASIHRFNTHAKGSYFGFERFVPQSEKALAQASSLPLGEMLFRPPNGQSAEIFFGNIRYKTPELIIPTDLAIIGKGIKEQNRHGARVSINANAETIFSSDLLPFLDGLPHDPTSICLEITEQGGIPINFSTAQLKEIKNRGYSLSLDDVFLLDTEEWRRLGHFGEGVDIIKFPHQMAEIFRNGTEENMDEMTSYIQTVQLLYPNALLVMEGIRPTDTDMAPDLHAARIDIFQQSSYVPKAQNPSHSLQGMVFAEPRLAIVG